MLVAIVVLSLLSIGWYFIFPAFVTKELHEAPPQTSEVLNNGLKRESLGVISKTSLIPSAHEVAGTVSLIEGIDEYIHVRFEDLKIINGPDVRVFLAKDIDKNDAVELGPLKGTHGDFNYDVPEHINLEEYSKVLIWCEDFNVLFAYADFAK